MSETTNAFLKKTIFWQRIAMSVLTLFLIVMWAAYFYYFVNWVLERNSLSEFAMKRTPEFVIGLIMLAYLLGGMYANWTIFKSSSHLKKYLATENINDLELAFKNQRFFWMSLTLMTISLVLAGAILFAVISYERSGAMSTPASEVF